MRHKLASVLFAVTIFNLAFYDHGVPLPGTIGFVIFIASAVITLILAFPHSPRRISRQFYLIPALAIFTAGISLFRASIFDRLTLGFTSFFLASTYLYLNFKKTHHLSFLTELLAIPPTLFAKSLTSGLHLLLARTPKIISGAAGSRSFSLVGKTLALTRALVITLPIALLMVALLRQGDLAFNLTIQNLLHWQLPDFLAKLPGRVYASSLIVILTLTLENLAASGTVTSFFNRDSYRHHQLEALVLTFTITFILTVFLIIQFPYLFSTVPETALSQFGVATFSEYIRKGFFELLFVSAITYSVAGFGYVIFRSSFQKTGLAGGTDRGTPKKGPLVGILGGKSVTGPAGFLLLTTILLLTESLLFIFSVFRRVYLYQAAHGLTLARIYGMLFLITMIGFTLILILRLLLPRFTHYYRLEFSLLLLTVFSPILINPEHLIAHRFPPTVNGETDYTYLARLGADSPEAWLEAFTWAKTTLANTPLQTPDQPLTIDQLRHFTYARSIIESLSYTYSDLTRLHGTKSQYDFFNQPSFLYYSGNRYHNNHWFTFNYSEYQAYLLLRRSLEPQQLLELQLKIEQVSASLTPAQINQTYDRSFDSPLLD